MFGVRADGTRELIALDDGHRESTESWLDLLCRCKRRSIAAPVLAVGDVSCGSGPRSARCAPRPASSGAGGTRSAACSTPLPASAQPGAKKALAEIRNAENKDHAQAAANVFTADYGTKWAKAAAKFTDDLDVLLAFYDYPTEH